MTSTGIDLPAASDTRRVEEWQADKTAIAYGTKSEATGPARYSSSEDSLKPVYDHTHRKLKPRHIQLIGIGG